MLLSTEILYFYGGNLEEVTSRSLLLYGSWQLQSQFMESKWNNTTLKLKPLPPAWTFVRPYPHICKLEPRNQVAIVTWKFET